MFQKLSPFALVAVAALTGGSAVAQGFDDQERGRLERQRDKKLAKPFIAQGGWLLDYDKARAKARQEGKFLLAYFTRSYSP